MLSWQAWIVLEGGGDQRELESLRESVELLDRPELAGVDTRSERALVLSLMVRRGFYPEYEQTKHAGQESLALYESLGDQDKALEWLEQGKVVIFAGGTGNPYFTTDTAAALRAVETKCEILFKGTNVDGVYTDDPRTNPDAKKLDQISYREALAQGLRVMDQTAFALCGDNGLPIVVFDISKPGNVKKAVLGEAVGTRVCD